MPFLSNLDQERGNKTENNGPILVKCDEKWNLTPTSSARAKVGGGALDLYTQQVMVLFPRSPAGMVLEKAK
jgi:hypothetical protein